MSRFLAQMILSLLANAIALLAASMLLIGFTINAVGFVVAVCIFTASMVILEPLITKFARQNAPYLLGGIALVTTFVGLLVTTLVTDGLSISGIRTWLIATLRARPWRSRPGSPPRSSRRSDETNGGSRRCEST